VSAEYKLQKLKAGDYLLWVTGDDRLWRVVQYEGLGSGRRGMYAEPLWGVEQWLGRSGASPDPDDPAQWAMVEPDRGTRKEAIAVLLKRLASKDGVPDAR
jgi:hypothetical protein